MPLAGSQNGSQSTTKQIEATTQRQVPISRLLGDWPSEPGDLAGACSGGKFVVPGAGEAYDAQIRSRNRDSRKVG